MREGADIVLGNLEGAISDTGADTGKLYSFRFAPGSLGALKKAGFDVLNVANNHVADWGWEPFVDSLARIKSAGIFSIGGGVNSAEAASPAVIEKNGVRIGFLGFSDVGPRQAGNGVPGVLTVAGSDIEKIVAEAKNKSDQLIVAIHFGAEYESLHNERQEEIAHRLIDAGADAVIGHHPHVIQDDEWYNGGYIAYSLGNFIFDQNFSSETMEGLTVYLTITKDGVKSVDKKKVKLNASFQPEFEE